MFIISYQLFHNKKCALNWRQVNRNCAVPSCGGDYENHLGKRAGISPYKRERNFSPFTEPAHLAGSYKQARNGV